MRLTDKQWEKIRDLVPDGPVRSDGKGRPWKDKREVLEGILWIVKADARWRDLPKEYPPYQTCSRRFQQWVEAGFYDKIIETLARDLQERGGIDMRECFTRGTLSLAKREGILWAKLNWVKAVRSCGSRMLVVLFYLSRYNLQALTCSHLSRNNAGGAFY